MIYHEEKIDLFSVDESYYLAHCISADFALGKGIAVEFDRRFNMRQKLFDKFPEGFDAYLHQYNISGECILIDRVLNLVTKVHYWEKPTYESLYQSLTMAREVCIHNNITKLAMPKIGCGLDRLLWSRVKNIIIDKFNIIDNIEILVCFKE